MTAVTLPDISMTTHKLFLEDDFDPFLVSEMSLSTFCTFQTDGRISTDYFSEDELSALPDRRFISWKQLRPCACQLIRGSRLPGQFRIVFRLSDRHTENFLRRSGLACQAADVGGLYLNIRYASRTLSCSTGTALNTFDLSRELDHMWDRTVLNFLRQHKIPFEEN